MGSKPIGPTIMWVTVKFITHTIITLITLLPILKEQYVRAVSRTRNSWHTKSQYSEGLKRLDEFCLYVLGHPIETEIELILNAQLKQEGRVYRTLDLLVGWMMDRGLAANTISGYMSVAKGYLQYNDVEIHEKKYKIRVKLPMKYPIPDKLLDKETIKFLVQSKIDKRLKVLIYLLSSSGLRLQEALTLRMRDVDLDDPLGPPIITLAGQFTKNGQPREAYMTTESAEAIKTLKRKDDQYIFDFMEGKDPDPNSTKVKVMGIDGYRIYMAEKKVSQMLRRLTKSLHLDDKLEGHKFHVIHFHTFRKYFNTTVAHFAGHDYAQLLMGHKQYMGMYNLTPKEEYRKIYREKLEKNLTIAELNSDSKEVNNLIKRIEEQDKQIKELNKFKDEMMNIVYANATDAILKGIESKNKKHNNE